eukprot:scaffold39534_cov84-Phaeocystis_antarctica.AAC.2
MACGKRVGVGTAVTRQALRREAFACGDLEPGLPRAVGPSRVHSCKAVHARPPAAVFAGRGHGVAATRKDGTRALVGVRWLTMHVELKVSAPFECDALHCASSAVHRAIVHTLRSDGFCGRWLIPGPQATSHSAAAAGPYQLTSRELRGLQGGSCAPVALLPTAAHAPAPGVVVRVRRPLERYETLQCHEVYSRGSRINSELRTRVRTRP